VNESVSAHHIHNRVDEAVMLGTREPFTDAERCL